ncbi:MAG: glycosyltransferase [bacterium]|nr:glycosyltransferase [bacterium]
MKVLYFWEPKGGLSLTDRTNPYGPLLTSALEKQGTILEFGQYSFEKSYLEDRRTECTAIHINWLHHFYKAEDLGSCVKRYHDFAENLNFARNLGYRIVWTAHNVYPHERQHPEIDHLARLMMCQTAHEVVAHCNYAADLVRNQFYRTGNLHVIPHGNYIDAYPNDISRSEARKKLGIPESRFVYLFVGNARPYKGLEHLVHAFRDVNDGDTELILAARRGLLPQYAEQIEAMVEGDPNIHMYTSSFFAAHEFQLYLNAADVVVLPFTNVLTSGTAIMALSFGKPVVMPRIGCLPELVDDSMGILYDPKDWKALQKSLIEIRKRDLKQASLNAFNRAKELDWNGIASSLSLLYRD